MEQGKNQTPPPKAVPGGDKPDIETEKADIYTEGKAHGQVLHCRLGTWFAYGTDDKIHAGALVLSFVLLGTIGLIALLGLFPCLKINTDILNMLGNALLLAIGAAIGRSTAQ